MRSSAARTRAWLPSLAVMVATTSRSFMNIPVEVTKILWLGRFAKRKGPPRKIRLSSRINSRGDADGEIERDAGGHRRLGFRAVARDFLSEGGDAETPAGVRQPP